MVGADNGVLVPPGEPLALRETLQMLMKDPDRRVRMGRSSRALAEREYDGRKTTSDLLSMMRSVAGTAR
jgi:glycosyltransferase involved in cell wall biosynthesis